MFHGTDEAITEIDELSPGYLCLAPDRKVARAYGAIVHTVEIADSATVVSEGEAADLLGLDTDDDLHLCSRLDAEESVETLRAAGIDAVEHADAAPPPYEADHDTLRVLNADVVQVVDRQTPPCDCCGEQFDDWGEFDICEGCV